MSQPPTNHAILASHGTDDPIGKELIRNLVEAVAAMLPDVVIHETFVDVQQPQIGEVLAGAVASDPAGEFNVVPLLLATGYHVRQDITDAVMAVAVEFPDTEIRVTPALGPSSELIDLLYQRLRESGWQPDDIVVVSVAGSSDAAAVEEGRLVHAILRDAIQSAHPAAQVELAFLSAAEPKLKDLVPKLKFQNPRKRVVVANYLLAPGFFDGLARRSGAHIVAHPLLAPNTDPAEQLIRIIARRVAEAQDIDGRLGCRTPESQPFSCAAGCERRCR